MAKTDRNDIRERIQEVAEETGIPVKEFEKAIGYFPEVEKANKIEKIIKVYQNSPSGSEAQKAALAKWKKLALKEVKKAKTIKEARKAYRNSPDNSEVEKAALAKWKELSLKEIKKAKTIEEVKIASFSKEEYILS